MFFRFLPVILLSLYGTQVRASLNNNSEAYPTPKPVIHIDKPSDVQKYTSEQFSKSQVDLSHRLAKDAYTIAEVLINGTQHLSCSLMAIYRVWETNNKHAFTNVVGLDLDILRSDPLGKARGNVLNALQMFPNLTELTITNDTGDVEKGRLELEMDFFLSVPKLRLLKLENTENFFNGLEKVSGISDLPILEGAVYGNFLTPFRHFENLIWSPIKCNIQTSYQSPPTCDFLSIICDTPLEVAKWSKYFSIMQLKKTSMTHRDAINGYDLFELYKNAGIPLQNSTLRISPQNRVQLTDQTLAEFIRTTRLYSKDIEVFLFSNTCYPVHVASIIQPVPDFYIAFETKKIEENMCLGEIAFIRKKTQ